MDFIKLASFGYTFEKKLDYEVTQNSVQFCSENRFGNFKYIF